MEKLPTYELRINPDDDSFVSAIALVEEPAIEADFLAFAKQGELHFAMDDQAQELLGPAMIPDMKIFRKDEKGEYYVFFSKETIRQIAQTFFEKGFQKSINLDHTDKDAHTTVFQSYIVDSAKGISAPKGMELPDGTWIIGAKVHDKKLWENIKSGNAKYRGFSIEGMFQFFNRHIDVDQEILDTLKHLNNLINKSK